MEYDFKKMQTTAKEVLWSYENKTLLEFIYRAFIWINTPQGSAFWSSQMNEVTPEGQAAIAAMIAQAEKELSA